MIALEMVEQIKRLLAEGNLSQRAIARLTGVSRGTVNAIAQGKRHEPRYARQEEEEEEVACGPPQRCPSCGGLVYMPCRLCRVRTALAKGPIERSEDPPSEPMRTELTVEQWKRYRQFYVRRLQALMPQDSASPTLTEGHSHAV